MADYDLVVIGAGPGGYVAAIRAAQLGLRTAVVERDAVGGICLNWGCIPSKALLKNAEVIHLFQRAEEFGVVFDNVRYDFGKAIARSRTVVGQLAKGVETLLRKNKVRLIKGEARLKSREKIEIKETGETFSAKNIIIATGARPKTLPVLPIDGEVVITSRKALEMREVPKSVAIVGGGATGVEFAYLYRAYGVEVTIVEILPHLVPQEDAEVSQHLERAFAKQGIKAMTNSKVTGFSRDGRIAKLEVTSQTGTIEMQCSKVLVAVGVQGNIEDIGLDELGVETEKGYIKIDDRMMTSVPGIYAIGDVTGKLLLAHVASAQGVAAVEKIAGVDTQALDYILMPKVTYCQPQVASFGMTEKQARERGVDVKIGMFPFQASGKALALGDTEGLVKLVVDKSLGEIIGVHMIGAEVSELVGELSLARLLEGTIQEVGRLIHPHPTLSEALKEAALAADGRAIHI